MHAMIPVLPSAVWQAWGLLVAVGLVALAVCAGFLWVARQGSAASSACDCPRCEAVRRG